MDRRSIYEMVRLRDAHPVIRAGTRFKVTARYVVDLGGGKSLSCVRVRAGVGPVLHFSKKRFAELFEPESVRR